jgi:signal peptidase I
MDEQSSGADIAPVRRTMLTTAAAVGAVLVVVSTVVIAVLVVAALVLGMRISGRSMTPTLGDGEHVLVLPGTSGHADRFTLVVFHIPQQNSAIVKRVIAVAGDRIAIDARPRTNVVLLQERGRGPWYRVDVPSWRTRWTVPTSCCTAKGTSPGASSGAGTSSPTAGGPIVQTVPPGRFFYLGDNPDGSEDSRVFGWGSVHDVDGRVCMGIWPLGRLGGFADTPTLTVVPAPR